MKNNGYRRWLIIYEKIIIYVSFAIIVIVGVIGILYARGSNTDLPICNHREVEKVGFFGSLFASEAKNQSYHLLPPSLPKLYSGCKGHTPDTLDIGSLKTGDILAVSYNGIRKVFSRCIYKSSWTHVGLVWIDNETKEPFVLEASLYKPPYISQIIRIPLILWIKINRNANVLAHVPINKAVDSLTVSKHFSRFEKGRIGIEAFKPSWIRFLQKKPPHQLPKNSLFYHPENDDKKIVFDDDDDVNVDDKNEKEITSRGVFTDFNPIRDLMLKIGITKAKKEYQYENVATCHEILIDVLQKSEVLSSEFSASSYLPSELVNGKIKTINGYNYLPSKHISVDPIVEQGNLW